MDDYVSKPIRPADLMGRIKRCLTGERTAAHAPAEAAARDERLNWSAALEATGGDRDLLQEVVRSILIEWPDLLRQLEASVSNRDDAVIQRAAHTVAGTMRMFRAESLVHSAARLEQAGQSGELDAAGPLLQALQQQMRHVMEELQEFLAREEPRKAD